MKQIEKLVRAAASSKEFVIATIVDTEGSAPGHVGFRMLVFDDGIEGTVGGGALEQEVIEQARSMLKERTQARLFRYNLSQLEMDCGGKASVFLEPCFQKPPIWIFGAGHIARALAPIVSSFGFRLTVVDNREGFAVPERFPSGTTLLTGNYLERISDLPSFAYAVIVTHGHAHDEEIVNALAARKETLPYIGMIGSKRKVLLVLKRMAENGLSFQDNIYTPIGLKIGGDSAEEIAVSIAAEILGVYHKTPNLPHWRLDLPI